MLIIQKSLVCSFLAAGISNAAYATNTQNFDANHCEFFVDGLAQVYQYNQAWYRRSLHAEVLIQDPTLNNAGMWIQYRDLATGTVHETTVQAEEHPLLSPLGRTATALEFAYEGNAVSGGTANRFSYEIIQFAFFAEREEGRGPTRLWISDNGKNFSLPSAFSEPTYTNSLGRGSATWTNQNVAVFHQKQMCQTQESSLKVSPGGPMHTTAASDLKARLSAGVLGENFVLTSHTFSGAELGISPTGFTAKALSGPVSNKVLELCLQRENTSSQCGKVKKQLLRSRVSDQTGRAATKVFARWLNAVDDNNWFLPADAEKAIAPYFESSNRRLYFFEDFDPENSLVNAVSTMGLPVVVDPEDQSVTIWTIQLND
jgi:hypothetical protein